MPIYEYKCPACGRTSEVLVHGFFSPPPPKCPGCGQDMKRLLSAPAVAAIKNVNSGKTCCGREERCEKPPCSSGKQCRRA